MPRGYLSLGATLNNALNIKWVRSTHWVGQWPTPIKGFCHFDDPIHSFRAGFIILAHYITLDHLMSIRSMITRWAPPSENPTDEYINNVCSGSKLSANNLPTSPDEWCSLVQWMSTQELGRWIYTADILASGYALAALDEPYLHVPRQQELI